MSFGFAGNDLRVLVVYDGFIAGIRALALLRSVDGQCGACGRLNHLMLRVDLLADPIIFELSIKAALDADILVISTAEGAELPQRVRAWIDRCRLTKEGRPLALFVTPDHRLMVPNEHAGAGPLLASMARYGMMEFFTDDRGKCEAANSRNFKVEGHAFDSGQAGSHASGQN